MLPDENSIQLLYKSGMSYGLRPSAGKHHSRPICTLTHRSHLPLAVAVVSPQQAGCLDTRAPDDQTLARPQRLPGRVDLQGCTPPPLPSPPSDPSTASTCRIERRAVTSSQQVARLARFCAKYNVSRGNWVHAANEAQDEAARWVAHQLATLFILTRSRKHQIASGCEGDTPTKILLQGWRTIPCLLTPTASAKSHAAPRVFLGCGDTKLAG